MNREFVNVEYGNHGDQWAAMLTVMDSGQPIEVHESIYWYFLEVLPPRQMQMQMFVFCEGHDLPTVFVSENGRYAAMKIGAKIDARYPSAETMRYAWQPDRIRETARALRGALIREAVAP